VTMAPPVRDPLVDMSGRILLRNSLLFARALRARGVPTDLAGAIDFGRALTIVEIGDRTQVHAAGAAIFVRRRDDLPVYDEVFREFWRRHELRIPPAPIEVGEPRPPSPRDRDLAAVESRPEAPEAGRRGVRGRADPTAEDAESEAGEAVAVSPRAWSAIEMLRHREFERMTAAELREAERLIDLLRPHLEVRRTRRNELHRHGTVLAPRAMLRRNLKTGGDLVDWVWRRPASHPRSIVVICDVSGSMERHSRLMLRFVHAIFRSPGIRAEAFVFGTHLTRITRDLRARDPDRALARISESVTDWSGGTRIGDSFREFNLRWARRVLSTSGIVVVLSDGWDRGDPAIVRDETARLQRSCHRLVWIDPLAGGTEPRPLAAGMAAAYPSIDDFIPVRDLASLQLLGEVLAGVPGDRPGRPERRGRPRVHRVERSGAAGHRRTSTERDALRALRGAMAAPLEGRMMGGSVPRTIA
jgi:uncharacterized protein with von Willebrand factor type A (vWA) domain